MTPGPDLRRAAELAARALVARGVDGLPASPLSMLHACRDTRVYTHTAAAEVAGIPLSGLEAAFRLADAITYCAEEDGRTIYSVVFRADGNPARLRFTLAHELGHRIMHRGQPDEWAEQEADCFASHLLCPESVVRRICERTPDHEAAVTRIAGVCYVTRACARAALKRRRIDLPAELACAMEELAERTLNGNVQITE